MTSSRCEVFSNALSRALNIFHISSLKPDQEESVHTVVFEHKDLLAVLPTGYGKSIIYQIIPKLCEEIHFLSHGVRKTFSVIVVSPLEYIRKQQKERLINLTIKAACLEESSEFDKEISEGCCEIIFGSAEQWLKPKWKKILQQNTINAMALVVDEVHTVDTW